MTSKLKTDVLETGSGSGTIALNNQLSGMTADSMPSGSVVQVVNSSYSTSTSTTSTTWTASGLAATITPSSTSSKILVTVTAPVYTASLGTYAAMYSIFRGSVSGTNLGHATKGFVNLVTFASGSVYSHTYTAISMSYMDSPATVGSQTYTIGMRSEGNSNTVQICPSSTKATVTLTEIKG